MFAATFPSGVLLWGGILAAGVALLGAGVWIIRRRVLVPPSDDAADVWSLQQLRELHARGQITDAEFQSLRDDMLRQMGARSPDAPEGETTPPRSGTEA